MNSDDSRSMSAFSANACLCAEYGFPIKHDARDNPPLNLESLKDAVDRFASSHGFGYTLAKSPARRKTIKWLQFTCTQCAACAAPLRAASKRRRVVDEVGARPDLAATLPVHSVRIKYAFGDDQRVALASYSLMNEQWVHGCGVTAATATQVPAAAAAVQILPAAPAAPAPTKQTTQPAHILQNLIDSRIEHAVYVAMADPTPSALFTTGVCSSTHPIVTFVCPLDVTSAARAALVTDTMQAMCDAPHTVRIADVRVTAERCKLLSCEEACASRTLAERLLIRVFL